METVDSHFERVNPFFDDIDWATSRSYPTFDAHQQSHEVEIREMVDYYRSRTDDPGEIVFIAVLNTPPDFIDLCRDLRVTCLLSLVNAFATPTENVERIREGPQTNFARP